MPFTLYIPIAMMCISAKDETGTVNIGTQLNVARCSSSV